MCQTVKPFNPEVVDKVLGDEEERDYLPAGRSAEPELATLESEMKEWKSRMRTFSPTLFPQVAVEFFKYRQAQETRVDPTAADSENGAHPV